MDRTENKKAFAIGVVCIVSYIVTYYLRNILSVMSPQLVEDGIFTLEHIGVLSSVQMLFYAGGQLINGFIGDFLSPKKMVLSGLCISGVVMAVIPFSGNAFVRIALFAIFGFAVSMLRGPLMKIIAENTKPDHARLICVFFSFASFAGPLIASFFAMLGNWKWTFISSGITSVIIGGISFFAFAVMEKKASLSYKSAKGEGFLSLFSVFKIEKFIFYMVIAALVEISVTSISFWIPTYLTDSLKFEKTTANMIFSAIAVVRSFMPFLALFLFRITKEKDVAMMRVCFAVSGIIFAIMLLVENRWVSIILLLLSFMSISCTSAVLWSIYIPGLGKTGKVSSVNGVLDCTGYIAAAAANIIFSTLMSNAGWDTVFLVWAGIEIFGVVVTLFCKDEKAKEK